MHLDFEGAIIFSRGVAQRNPYKHERKISQPSLYIFFVKNVTLPWEAVKFIVTYPFLLTNVVCGWTVQRSRDPLHRRTC